MQHEEVHPFELPQAHEQPDLPVNVLYIFLMLIKAASKTIDTTIIFPNIKYLLMLHKKSACLIYYKCYNICYSSHTKELEKCPLP